MSFGVFIFGKLAGEARRGQADPVGVNHIPLEHPALVKLRDGKSQNRQQPYPQHVRLQRASGS